MTDNTALLPSDEGGANAWGDHALAAVSAIEKRIMPLVREASDELYAQLLYATQDYLRDNVLDNFASELHAARTRVAHERQRATEAEALASELRAALEALVALARDYIPDAETTELLNAVGDADAVLAKAEA